MKKKYYLLLLLLLTGTIISAQQVVEFSRDNCQIFQGSIDTIGGRSAFTGTAILKDISFTNGTIEWDLWARGGRSYAGVIFRHQDNRDSEEFYVRPHKGNGLFGDAFQYSPVYHGVSCWQLAHGAGGTQAALIPSEEWIHFKLSVKDDRAVLTMFTENPVTMKINKLWLGDVTGSIGVKGPANGSTYFSNFKYSENIDIEFPASPLEHKFEPGIVRGWEISQVLSHDETVPYLYYSEFEEKNTGGKEGESGINWEKIEGEEDGLVNLTKHRIRNPQLPGWIYARTTIKSDSEKAIKYQLAYSDYVTVFVNGKPIMSSTNAYLSRDPSFAGLLGYFDEIFLPLEEGNNEICLLVGEQFGGWGFKMRDGETTGLAKGISMEWELEHRLGFPESIVYDPENDVLYASNFITETGGAISRLSSNGEMMDYEWVKGLRSPTGITIYENNIYVVERGGIVIINKANGEIIERIALEGSVFPNDITVCDDGVLYVSDSGGNRIYRIREKVATIWMEGGELKNPNGIDYHGGFIYVGCSGDASLKKIETRTFYTCIVTKLPEGSVLDGLQVTDRGEIFFSDFNGRLFHINAKGDIKEIINTVSRQVNLADFELIESKKLLVVPGLYSNVISAYSY